MGKMIVHCNVSLVEGIEVKMVQKFRGNQGKFYRSDLGDTFKLCPSSLFGEDCNFDDYCVKQIEMTKWYLFFK